MGGHGKADATATLAAKGQDQNKHEDEFGVMKADDAKKSFVPSHGITSDGARLRLWLAELRRTTALGRCARSQSARGRMLR
jgi:hypothetical protein